MSEGTIDESVEFLVDTGCELRGVMVEFARSVTKRYPNRKYLAVAVMMDVETGDFVVASPLPKEWRIEFFDYLTTQLKIKYMGGEA